MKKMLLFLPLITASLVYGMEERVNRIQQNPLLLFPEERERARAFAMALHPQLGTDSPANQLPQKLVKEITTMARNEVVDEWLKQNQNEIERLQNKSQEEKDEEKDSAFDFYKLHRDDYINPVRILLYAGIINPNRADPDGEVPLHRPAYFGHKEVVQILLAANANPNIANDVGMTPLYTAACFGHKEVVQILLAAGTDRTMRNMNEMTAAGIARVKGHNDIADFIEQWNPDAGPNQN